MLSVIHSALYPILLLTTAWKQYLAFFLASLSGSALIFCLCREALSLVDNCIYALKYLNAIQLFKIIISIHTSKYELHNKLVKTWDNKATVIQRVM
jgi:hypothetical protein